MPERVDFGGEHYYEIFQGVDCPFVSGKGSLHVVVKITLRLERDEQLAFGLSTSSRLPTRSRTSSSGASMTRTLSAQTASGKVAVRLHARAHANLARIVRSASSCSRSMLARGAQGVGPLVLESANLALARGALP